MASDSMDIKEDLCNYLQVVDSGNFAASGPLSNANTPGLFVKGIGKIGLPLSDRDAADLSRASHEAPFGKGNETLVDPKVRKTWELNPNQFDLRNPAWPATLQEVVGKVAEELGVVNGASGIRAEMHKLLLYEPGAFFDKHRDTEKAPGMFATLVIALPSEHTGGDVVVQLRDQEQILRTQGLCDFGYSYLAWYADVNHSVSKVESGYRLVLTYNLIRQASDSSLTASVLDDHKQNLNKVLSSWGEQDYPYDKLVYMLEHEYSEANICLDQLKGKDQLRMRYLLQACQKQGFCLFFAHLEYSQSGSIEEDQDDYDWPDRGNGADFHEFIDEIESNWKLSTIFWCDGKQVAENLDLEEKDLLQRVDFAGIDPDDEECDGYTGNEGCTATQFYHRTCAVILPQPCRLEFLSAAETFNVKGYVESLLEEMEDETLSISSREELETFCEIVITENTPPKPRKKYFEDVYNYGPREEDSEMKELSCVSEKGLASIGEAALRLDRPCLLEKVAGATSQMAQLHLFQKLGKGLIERDFSLWKDGLKLLLSRVPNISERVKAVDLFVSSYRGAAKATATTTQRMQDFEHEMAMSLTETQSEKVAVTGADAQTLMQLVERYGEKYALEAVLPLVKKHTSNLDFTLAFLTELFRAGETDKVRLEAIQNLFKDILQDVIPGVHLDYQEFGREQARNEFAKRRRLDYSNYGPQSAADQDSRVLTADNLATLFYQCDKLGLLHEIDQLSDKLISQTANANVIAFEYLLLPLLKQLPPTVKAGSNSSISAHSYAKIFRNVVSSYIIIYVRYPPQKPTGLERQPRGCGFLRCEDCAILDNFLKNPDKPRINFSIKAQRRVHLEERLRYSYCSTEIIKSGTPHTLVVKKIGLEWENAMKEWKQRCDVALKAVEKIGFEKLRGLLGEEWESAVGLAGIRPEGEERRPLGNLAQGKGTAGAGDTGVGGKVAGRVGPEIIDLSGE